MSVPPPHQRILPHMEISEQGLRELESWLRRIFKGDGGLLYHKGTYGPENNGDWLHITATSASGFFVGGDHGEGSQYSVGITGTGDVGIGAAGPSAGLYLIADGTIFMKAVGLNAEFDSESIVEGAGLTLNMSYIQSITNDLTFDVLGATFIGNTTSGGDIILALSPGKALQVQKSGGGVVFSVGADSTQILNLQAGKTAVINDHLGSPLVTYTG